MSLVEEEAGARLELRVAVDDRVDEAARRARDRQRAVALRVELHEPARLEAARDEHDVGRREDAVHERPRSRARTNTARPCALRRRRASSFATSASSPSPAIDDLRVGRRGGCFGIAVGDEIAPLLRDDAPDARR